MVSDDTAMPKKGQLHTSTPWRHPPQQLGHT
jgi:hypothetical protein